jgi:hypothetical protein
MPHGSWSRLWGLGLGAGHPFSDWDAPEAHLKMNTTEWQQTLWNSRTLDYLSACLSIHLSARPPIRPSAIPSVRLSACPSVCQPACLPAWLSACQPAHRASIGRPILPAAGPPLRSRAARAPTPPGSRRCRRQIDGHRVPRPPRRPSRGPRSLPLRRRPSRPWRRGTPRGARP